MEPQNKNLDKLADLGWQGMRGLLDREMPVEKRRRRPVFWLFWTAAAIAVAGSSFWAMKNRQPGVPKIEKPGVPVAVVQTENQPKVDFSKPEESEKQVSNLADKNLLTSKNPTSPQILPSVQFPKMKGGFSAPVVSFRRDLPKIETQFLILEGNARPDPCGMTPEGFKNQAFFEGSAAVKNLRNPEKLTDLYLAALPFLPFQTRFLENKNTPPSPKNGAFDPTTQKMSTKTDWHFGLTAAAVFSGFPRPNGLATGFSVDWQPTQKWGIRTGLQYQYLGYRFSDGLAVPSKINGNQYLDLTGDTLTGFGGSIPAQAFDLNSVEINVLVPVSRLHRLELPVQIVFFPAQKWPVFAGVSVSRTVGSRTDFVLAGDSKNTAPPAGAVARMNEILKKNISDWAGSWQAGFGFRANKRLEINLLLRKNLKNKNLAADFQKQSNFNSGLADQSYFESKSLKNYKLSELTVGKFVPEIQLGLRWQLR